MPSPFNAPRIRQVVTIGTPFNAETDHTHAGWLFRLLSGGGSALDPVADRLGQQAGPWRHDVPAP